MIVGTCTSSAYVGCSGPATCSPSGSTVIVCDGPTSGKFCCSSCPQADCGASNWNNCPTTSQVAICVIGVPVMQNPQVPSTVVCTGQYEYCIQ
jgi:hypothetical protein